MTLNREIRFIIVFLIVMLRCVLLPASRSREAVPLPFVSSLLSKEVTTLHQDRDGFIWIGTTYGAARYDGYETLLFNAGKGSSDCMTNNEVTTIADIPGVVLIGTKKGLNVIDKVAWKVGQPDEPLLRNVEIKCILTTNHSEVWVAVPGMVLRCDRDLHIKQRYVWPNAQSCGVTSLYQDRQGGIWIMTWGSGLYRVDTDKNILIGYPPVGRENRPFILFQDNRNRYWLGTWGDGLFRFYPDNKGAEIYKCQNVGGEVCFDIMQDSRNGDLWMLFYQSIGIFELDAQGQLHHKALPLNVDPNRMFSGMMQDRNGNIWLGAYDAGYQVVENTASLVEDSLSFIKRYLGFDANINCMAEDASGLLWLNQERYGLMLYNPYDGSHSLSIENPQVEVNYIEMEYSGSSAWVASKYVERVFRVRHDNMRLIFTDTLELNKGKEPLEYVTGVHLDKMGYLWTQTGRKLFVKPPECREMLEVKGVDEKITDWTEDVYGNVWLGTDNGRLYKVLHCKRGIRIVAIYSFKRGALKNQVLSGLAADKGGRIWLATSFGQMFCFEPENCKVIECTRQVTLGSRPILDLSVKGDTLCVLTPGALVCHDLKHHVTRVYEAGDRQIPVTSFRNSAICWGKGGRLYAGGHGGYVMLRSSSQSVRKHSEVMFTDISVNGLSLWKDSIGHVNRDCILCLSSDCRQMMFSFSTLEYDNRKRKNIRYEYRIDGEEGWNALNKGEHTAVYNYLPAGQHVLYVRALDGNDENIAKGALSFIRLPRWYETLWARIGFVSLILLVLALSAYGFVWNVRRKNERRLRQEIVQTKLEYFTNVSHELLTPLTVLSCLADEIEQKMPQESRFIDALRGNTRRLKKLIRQVLDFRKVENNAWPLRVDYADVMAFIRQMSDIDFTMLAHGKQLSLVQKIVPESAFGYYDADKLEEILFNLLSNAVKYTDSPGRVGINAWIEQTDSGVKQLCIEVWDEGVGIAEQEQQKIFTRFYHSETNTVSESNGIGLSLTQKLVSLHHGKLTLRSQQGEGSCFMVRLPLDKTCYTEEEIKEHYSGRQGSIIADSSVDLRSKATLLIIDDNTEILEAMEILLGEHYKVLVASEAGVARRFLAAERIDLVVCDVRMPDMDGLMFCRTIKSDVQTSHIPVLMLTAQNDEQTRMDCYEAGADGFMAKPFETKVLMARIENLLLQYKKRQEQFRTDSVVDLSLLSKRETDEDFLNKLIKTIEAYLQDTDFDLDLLAVAAGVSKSTLNRKIKTMTGLTPMDFVRNIRLKYACALLAEGKLNVSEVAYSVGFSDPQYFAKCFKEAFKETPSQFQRKNHVTH